MFSFWYSVSIFLGVIAEGLVAYSFIIFWIGGNQYYHLSRDYIISQILDLSYLIASQSGLLYIWEFKRDFSDRT